jgi:hypothetical protein
MWMPSYHQTWRTRLTEVEALSSLDERIGYAGRNGIDYVVDRCNSASKQGDSVFRTERLCVFPAMGAPLTDASSR